MNTKTDLYTKIVLTVIAIFLGVIVFRNIDFVPKAHANELDLSALTIEQGTDAETTLFIYENSELSEPFSRTGYTWERRKCEIGLDDIPKYVITNKTGTISK